MIHGLLAWRPGPDGRLASTPHPAHLNTCKTLQPLPQRRPHTSQAPLCPTTSLPLLEHLDTEAVALGGVAHCRWRRLGHPHRAAVAGGGIHLPRPRFAVLRVHNRHHGCNPIQLRLRGALARLCVNRQRQTRHWRCTHAEQQAAHGPAPMEDYGVDKRAANVHEKRMQLQHPPLASSSRTCTPCSSSTCRA